MTEVIGLDWKYNLTDNANNPGYAIEGAAFSFLRIFIHLVFVIISLLNIFWILCVFVNTTFLPG